MGACPTLQKSLPMRIFRAWSLHNFPEPNNSIENTGSTAIHKNSQATLGEFVPADGVRVAAFSGTSFMQRTGAPEPTNRPPSKIGFFRSRL